MKRAYSDFVYSMTDFCTNKAFVFLQYTQVTRRMQAAHDLKDTQCTACYVILICHNLPFLFPTCPQSSIFLHSFHPLLSHSNNHSTYTQMTPPPNKLRDTLIPTFFCYSVPRPPQTNLCFLEMSCNSISDCHATFCQSKEN